MRNAFRRPAVFGLRIVSIYLLKLALFIAAGDFVAAAFASSEATKVESPVATTVCELQKNPDSFDHRLVRVQGRISHEFEDFSLSDEACPESHNSVWLMYGDNAPDEITFCCNGTGHGTTPRIEGYDVPLPRDEKLKRLRHLLNSYHNPRDAKEVYFQTNPSYTVTATLEGRFFAGKTTPMIPGRGFGHMGCCTLLVITSVVSIDAVVKNVKHGDADCFSEYWNSPNDQEADEALNLQFAQSNEKWRTRDARRVASETLKNHLKDLDTTPQGLTFQGCKKKRLTYQDDKFDQYLTSCNWSSVNKKETFSVDVLKFYYLKSSDNKWKDIAWLPYEVYHSDCTNE